MVGQQTARIENRQCRASEKAETVKGLYAYPNSLED